MSIIINKQGHRLDNFKYATNESELLDVGNISGGHAVLMQRGKLIVCYNRYRNNWELPGGGRESGESLLDCVKREILEEIGQEIDILTLRGVSTVYIPRMGKPIFWAVFYGEIFELAKFTVNREMSHMRTWDMVSNIGDVDEVDFSIAKMVLKI
ncbi:NUDIX hydrolase [Bacillus niameyensis]|uniref:NUDIX hydrolase n=1 Tax=Bacillus niameyensis TaxID=1522308 RepID=UPI0007847BAA|nr:NUDIX hydrolase [Bacillus niameyensis]